MTIVGTFIDIDEHTHNMAHLEYARVLIQTFMLDQLSSCHNININGRLYLVHFMEEYVCKKQNTKVWTTTKDDPFEEGSSILGMELDK